MRHIFLSTELHDFTHILWLLNPFRSRLNSHFYEPRLLEPSWTQNEQALFSRAATRIRDFCAHEYRQAIYYRMV